VKEDNGDDELKEEKEKWVSGVELRTVLFPLT